MDLSRIASIHKSIITWKNAEKQILDANKRAAFKSLVQQLQTILFQAWSGQAPTEAIDQQIETLRSQIDCLYDESRLLSNQ